MNKIAWIISTLLLSTLSLPAWAGGIQVEGAWVRAAPPTVQVLAAYMTIKNTGTIGKTIIGAHSPQFAKVEFHETLLRNGMASMVARQSLVIDSGGQVILAPGGYHMMLIAPQRMIRPGDQIDIILTFSDGSALPIAVDVKKGNGKTMDHSTMNHTMGQQGGMNHQMMMNHNRAQQGGMNHQMMMNHTMAQQGDGDHQQMMKHNNMNHQQMMEHNRVNHEKMRDQMMALSDSEEGMVCPHRQGGAEGKVCPFCMNAGKKEGGCMMNQGKMAPEENNHNMMTPKMMNPNATNQ
ncbi:MAG: copper chaperone PCu(A)C [Magnetococcales bacterium]|nr:copper chaperone PCu(A)C [Magnetococcales bacterium]